MNYTDIAAQAAEMTATQMYDLFVGEGWLYLPDGQTWTGGCWWHNKFGAVANGGGAYPTIMAATNALRNWYSNMAQISAETE